MFGILVSGRLVSFNEMCVYSTRQVASVFIHAVTHKTICFATDNATVSGQAHLHLWLKICRVYVASCFNCFARLHVIVYLQRICHTDKTAKPK